MIGYHKVVYFSHWIAIVSSLPHCLSLFFPPPTLSSSFDFPSFLPHPPFILPSLPCSDGVDRECRRTAGTSLFPEIRFWWGTGAGIWAPLLGPGRWEPREAGWPSGGDHMAGVGHALTKIERRGSTPLNETPTRVWSWKQGSQFKGEASVS